MTKAEWWLAVFYGTWIVLTIIGLVIKTFDKQINRWLKS